MFALAVILFVAAGVVLFTATADNEEIVQYEPRNPSKPLTKNEIIDAARSISSRYGVNPSIMLSFIELESSFDPKAVGDNGRSFGLLQIQEISYRTTLEHGYSSVQGWRDQVRENLTVGARYMVIMSEWYEARYNAKITPTVLREIWTLGPGAYSSGKRMPSEVARMNSVYPKWEIVDYA